jgi:hypothetical protein
MKKTFAAIILGVLATEMLWGETKGGSSELTIGGTLQYMTSGNSGENKTTALQGQFGYNYFITEWFSLGLSAMPVVQISEPKGSSKTTSDQFFGLARGDFYIPNKTIVVPYIGGHGGFIYYSTESGNTKNSGTVGTGGGQGGLKFYTSENTSLKLEGDVSFYKEKSSSNKTTIFSLIIGFSYYF